MFWGTLSEEPQHLAGIYLRGPDRLPLGGIGHEVISTAQTGDLRKSRDSSLNMQAVVSDLGRIDQPADITT